MANGWRLVTLPCTAMLLAACATGPSPVERVLPGRIELVRGGLAPDGDLVVALTPGSASACRSPELLRRRPAGWQSVASGSSTGDPPCPSVSARVAPDGGRLATHDGGDEVRLWRLGPAALEPDGVFRLIPGASFPFPAPGPNLAFGAGGWVLLVGALNRACGRQDGELRCGVAELAAREPAGWQNLDVLRPPGDAALETRFGQAVAMTADGRLILVGGTGQPGRSGALWLFAREAGPARPVATLRPDRHDPWFANDLSLAADGSRLAVGGAHAVYLFARAGDGYVLERRLAPPDASAGYFGEAVALAADGRTLLVGAPRADCATGARCGRAYLYRRAEAWALARELEPAARVPEATFARRVALDASGRRAAVQGAALHVFDLP